MTDSSCVEEVDSLDVLADIQLSVREFSGNSDGKAKVYQSCIVLGDHLSKARDLETKLRKQEKRLEMVIKTVKERGLKISTQRCEMVRLKLEKEKLEVKVAEMEKEKREARRRKEGEEQSRVNYREEMVKGEMVREENLLLREKIEEMYQEMARLKFRSKRD